MENIKKYLKKDKWIILTSLLIGLLATGFVQSRQYSETVSQGLEQNLIRFHVLANSDSEEDQNLKLKVRDAVLEEMQPILKKAQNIEESRNIINFNMDKIKNIAEEMIKQEGKDYEVTVALENTDFPTKKYGDVVLPSGEYEALRIIIGDGGGKNWWCVMFPPLCFVDITHGTIPEESKEELQKILTEEEFAVITQTEETPVKIKFKIVEWWQERKQEKEEEKVLFFVQEENNVSLESENLEEQETEEKTENKK